MMGRAGSPGQALTRAFLRVIAVIAVANVLFLALLLVSQPPLSVIHERIREAFETGELGLEDYLPLGTTRGVHQYNDCLVLQMISNPNPDALSRALAPIIYKTDEHFTVSCPVLRALVVDGADSGSMLWFRYARYWHGNNALAGAALQILDLGSLRRGLVLAVFGAIGLLAFAALRTRGRLRGVALLIALVAATVWAVPSFDPGLTHGPGDALVLLGLVPLVLWPRLAVRWELLLPYVAGLGAVLTFFEHLTGQLPTAGAWIVAAVLAAVPRERLPYAVRPRSVAIAALLAFGLSAAVTVLVKQLLGLVLVEPAAGSQVLAQLERYTAIPAADDGLPGVLVPFRALARSSANLTYGRPTAAVVLIAGMTLAWIAATVRGWRLRRTEDGRDALLLAGAALIPAAWVMLLPTHTNIHAGFMVRMLVVPLSLGPLALAWPGLPGFVWRRARLLPGALGRLANRHAPDEFD
jgi:hypothetical protein